MRTIESLFKLHNARACGFQDHEPGRAAFVTNGLRNNGVAGYVTPLARDRVFDFVGIVISTFCEATVQLPPFIGRGNGGSALIILEPKRAMNVAQMAHIAAYINTAIRWRFNWYRQTTIDRIRLLEIPHPRRTVAFSVGKLIPKRGKGMNGEALPRLRFKPFPLTEVFAMEAGEFHNASDLEPGNLPLISCGDRDNGIMAFVSVPDSAIHRDQLTIAFNGDTLTTKYHAYPFAAKDDVAVCTPRSPMRIATKLFIQAMMEREKWRYSYYRKCFMEKLRRQTVELPSKAGTVDEDAIEQLMETAPYWNFIKARMA